MRPTLLVGLAALFALTACAQGAGETPEESAAASPLTPIPARSAEPIRSADASPATVEVPDTVLAAVIADAMERTGAGEDEITVLRGEAVTWKDGSLGCPEPGMSYTQALIDGYHVILDVAGDALDYRVGSGTIIRLCEGPIEGGG